MFIHAIPLVRLYDWFFLSKIINFCPETSKFYNFIEIEVITSHSRFVSKKLVKLKIAYETQLKPTALHQESFDFLNTNPNPRNFCDVHIRINMSTLNVKFCLRAWLVINMIFLLKAKIDSEFFLSQFWAYWYVKAQGLILAIFNQMLELRRTKSCI